MRPHQIVCFSSKLGSSAWIAALFLTILARAGAAAPLELSSPNAEILGLFGCSVSTVPDVNGDGRSDVVVGAYLEDSITGATDAGRAYILCGSTGAVLHSLLSPNEEAFGAFGWSVSGVPDVNGDGRGDVIVGAYGEDVGAEGIDTGRVYIFSGSDGSLLRPLFSPHPKTGGFFGFSVSGIPDIDRDGRGDLLVGAYDEDTVMGATNAGQVYVFSGFDGRILHVLTSPNSQHHGAFGISVSGVPDVDGDGLDDLVVGADKEDSTSGPEYAGRAYVFSSSDGEVLHTLVSPNEQHEGWFGVSVSGTADVDGDSRGDVIVGAQFDSSVTGPHAAGRAYIFSGSSGTLLHTLVSPNEEEQGRFGYSVSGVADWDADGRGDVVVGAGLEDPGTCPTDAGRAYIVSGSDGSVLHTLASPNEQGYGAFGLSVSGSPRVDGDGQIRIVVGAAYEVSSTGQAYGGRAYVSSQLSLLQAHIQVLAPGGPLDFGAQEVSAGPGASQAAVVKSIGEIPLLFRGAGIFIDGPDAGEFLFTSPPDPSPLFPNEIRSLVLCFDPSSGGGKNATLTLTTNDPDHATTEIALLGIGTTPTLTPTITPTATSIPTHTPTPTATPTATHASPSAVLLYAPKAGGAPLEVELFGSGFDPDGWLTEYRWSFTDWPAVDATAGVSSPFIEAATSYVYETPGVYQVGFQVQDNDGAQAQATGQVVVWTPIPTQRPSYTATSTPTPCPWEHCDVNQDGTVDHLDILELQHWWQEPH